MFLNISRVIIYLGSNPGLLDGTNLNAQDFSPNSRIKMSLRFFL
jgi:hypothetical protein